MHACSFTCPPFCKRASLVMLVSCTCALNFVVELQGNVATFAHRCNVLILQLVVPLSHTLSRW